MAKGLIWVNEEAETPLREGDLSLFHSNAVRSTSNDDMEHKLFFLPDATLKLKQHVGWGVDTADNQVEQGGLLIGTPFRDLVSDTLFAEVDDIIPAHEAEGSMKHLHFSVDCWRSMLHELDDIQSVRSEAHIVGWYHTHPKHLKVYCSDTDKIMHHKWFRMPWHFAVILNPQKSIWKAFQGKGATPVAGVWINQ